MQDSSLLVKFSLLYLFLLYVTLPLDAYHQQKHFHPVINQKIKKHLKQNNIKKKTEHIDFRPFEEKLKISLSSEVKRYYQECDSVNGWFERNLIFVFLVINNFQKQHGMSAHVAEIGVWQGKSFIPLMHLIAEDEYALAVDCFEQYEFNRSNSGGGPCSLTKFTNNIAKYCSQGHRLKTMKGDSSAFTAQHYHDAVGNNKGFRIVSIDGCHEAIPTKIDLDNAFKCLIDGGVIVIDDYFHSGWPGVSEGVNAWMNENKQCLQPFLIAWNKVFFAKPAYVQQYSEVVKKCFSFKDTIKKKFFDRETLICVR